MRSIPVAHRCHRVSRLHLESLKGDYSILVKFCVGMPYQELDFEMTLQAIPKEGLAGSPSLFSVTPYRKMMLTLAPRTTTLCNEERLRDRNRLSFYDSPE